MELIGIEDAGLLKKIVEQAKAADIEPRRFNVSVDDIELLEARTLEL